LDQDWTKYSQVLTNLCRNGVKNTGIYLFFILNFRWRGYNVNILGNGGKTMQKKHEMLLLKVIVMFSVADENNSNSDCN
jgi:hypothetical protein